jgi:hypothetical protein
MLPGDGYHVIVAILLLLHEPPKDEPAQQQDVANGFSNHSDGRPVSGCSPIVFVVGAGRPKKSPSLAEELVFYLKKFVHNGRLWDSRPVAKINNFAT